MRRSISVFLAFAFMAVLLAGCGGGGGGGINQGVIQFTAISYDVNEDGTPVQIITVERSGGTAAVSVQVTFSDVSATAPSDYDPTPITLSWAAGDTSPKTFAVPIVDDHIDEPDESILMRLQDPTGGAILGSQFTSVLVILDNDVAGTVQFDFDNYFYDEDGFSGSPITVTRTGGMDGDISVTVTSNDDTANSDPLSLAEPLDYSAISVTVFFADQSTTPVVVALSIVNDLLPEAEENFFVSLSNPTNGATIGSPSSANVFILDDDDVLQIDNPAGSINGHAGSSVAKIGQRLAIGAPGNNSGAGLVYAIDVDFGTVHDTFDGGPFSQGFGRSLSSVGSSLGIGGTNSAWAFGGNALKDNYTERFGVSNPDGGFGAAVLIHGGRLVVGAPDAQIGGSLEPSGRVYSYDEFSGSPFPALDGTADNHFGTSLAGFGSDLLVGAPGNVGAVIDYGGSPWAVNGVIANPSPQSPSNAFGTSVARGSNGFFDIVVVGVPDGDLFAPNDGWVQIFDGGAPVTILPPGPIVPNGRFGANVLVMDDDRICVQQPGGGPLGTGRIFVFDRTGAFLQFLDSPISVANGNFGASMCDFDRALAVGAPGVPGVVGSGTVFIMKLLPLP